MKSDQVKEWLDYFDKNPLDAVHQLLVCCVYMGPLLDACKPWFLLEILFSGKEMADNRLKLDQAMNLWLGKFITSDKAFDNVRPRLIHDAVLGVLELVNVLGLESSSEFADQNKEVIRKKLRFYESMIGPRPKVFIPEEYLGASVFFDR